MPIHSSQSISRRSFIAAASGASLLAACGGGGGAGGEPSPPIPPTGDHYTPLAPFSVSEHTASNARDGAVIVIGGSRGQGTFSDSVDRFDPSTRTFTRIGTLASGRAAHCATRLSAGGILVTGGALTQVDGRLVERVDDLTGRADAIGNMSVARVYHAAVELSDGRVLVAGGNATGEGALGGVSRSAEIWEPSTQRFRRLAATMQMARTAHSLTLLPDGRVLAAGGYTVAAPYVFAEIFDPATEAFEALSFATPVRASHAAHLVGGRVLLLGGERLAADGITAVPVASALAFEPRTRSFSALPDLSAPRTWAASVATPSGTVLMFGGQQEPPHYTATAEVYNPAAGGRAIASLEGERALHTATRLADGRVLVLGGEAWGGAYRSTPLLYG